MAKKKKAQLKIKLTKKQWAKVRKIGIPVIVGLLSLNIGIIGTRFFEARKQPRNIVWAAEKSVHVPGDLKAYLHSLNDCREYRGTGTPTGVGLWGVYQVSKGKFAKIAYGCSWSLNNYIMAVKEPSGWKLLPPTEYFAPFGNTASVGAVPFCAFIDQYKIDKEIEPFCIDTNGSARANVTP